MGIGSAIGYVLYKPLFDHDETKINEIISVFGYLYRWIGKIILIAGCILACFLPLIFPNTEFDLGLIFFAYFSFLASSLIGYFANYKQTLLGADQKNYVVTAYFQTATIIKTIIQMALAYYTGNYYLWVIVELSFGIIYSFILNWKINQVYPWLRSEVSQGRILFKKYPEVMKYTKQLFVHKFTTFIQFQTTPFLIYAFVSLQTVAFYGNYTIITDKLSVFIGNLLGSTGAGVGNLIAEGDRNKIMKVFWELLAIRFWFASIFIFALYFLLEPFIILWLGKQYILNKSILIILLCNVFIMQTRGVTDQFLYGYGLFRDVWAPIAEAVIYLVVALIAGSCLGLKGVLLGGIISMLIIVCGWKPVFLFKSGFHFPLYIYWFNWGKHLFLMFITFIIGDYVVALITIDPAENYWEWIKYAMCITSIFVLMYTSVLSLFSQGMRSFLQRILRIK